MTEPTKEMIEATARRLAYDEWPYASTRQRKEWSDKYWPKWVVKTKAALLAAYQVRPPTDADMRAFGASHIACYKWPDAGPEHSALRAAYCEGAADAVQPATPTREERDSTGQETVRESDYTRICNGWLTLAAWTEREKNGFFIPGAILTLLNEIRPLASEVEKLRTALEQIALLDFADGHELKERHAFEAVAIASSALGKHPSQINRKATPVQSPAPVVHQKCTCGQSGHGNAHEPGCPLSSYAGPVKPDRDQREGEWQLVPKAAVRCMVTGNQFGTDTWMVGRTCPCKVCQTMLATAPAPPPPNQGEGHG